MRSIVRRGFFAISASIELAGGSGVLRFKNTSSYVAGGVASSCAAGSPAPVNLDTVPQLERSCEPKISTKRKKRLRDERRMFKFTKRIGGSPQLRIRHSCQTAIKNFLISAVI